MRFCDVNDGTILVLCMGIEWHQSWRAPSSPHRASGLNRSFFPHTCGLLETSPAGGLLTILGGAEACGSLHAEGVRSLVSTGAWLEGKGAVQKKSNFSNQGEGMAWSPRIPWLF